MVDVKTPADLLVSSCMVVERMQQPQAFYMNKASSFLYATNVEM
jgi:hypothetical protein